MSENVALPVGVRLTSVEKYCMTSFICENETNELIHKINTDPQTQKRKLWLPGGEDGRKGQ